MSGPVPSTCISLSFIGTTVSTIGPSSISTFRISECLYSMSLSGGRVTTASTQYFYALTSTSSTTTSTLSVSTTPTTTPPTASSSTPTASTVSSSSSSVLSSTQSSSSPVSSGTPSLSTGKHVTSHGISNGAVAGIAIALLILGLAIGGFIGFVLAKRRKGRPSAAGYTSFGGGEKNMSSSSPVADQLQLDQFLLDPTPDSAISGDFRSLDHLIQQHVENNYHISLVPMNKNSLVEPLVFLGIEQENAASLAALLVEPKTRISAVRHIIARAAFESTSIRGSGPISLLPPGISAITAAIPPTESHTGNHQATETALIRWRQLSAFLLHPGRSDRTPLVPSENISTTQAHELSVALNRCLRQFVSGDREERYEQENHLREIIVECATFGYLLFSQPAEYRLQFYHSGSDRAIVVFPGLFKIADENGRQYKSPVPQLTAPVVEAV
ncbi:hypothetical protein F5Y16DRAFT_223689 [Xylariaceae sp. FL0255]|nr:hypothetical protein F5Y16DRAFT_223689 [Xylariaceae sp. FL0255]